MPYLCYIWNNTSVPWNMANWKWSECKLVTEVLLGIAGEKILPPWLLEEPYNPYDKEKRRRFIQLLCKVKNNIEYTEKKEVKEDITINVKDVALVIKSVSGIDITIN